MKQANPSRHLDALARFTAAIAEFASPTSDDALLFLRQVLGLIEVHVCRAALSGDSRYICGPDGTGTNVCHLPAPHWHHTVHQTRTDHGWSVGFTVNSHVDHTVLHMVFDRPPSPDDVAFGEVAAGLVTRTKHLDVAGGTAADAITGLPGRKALELDLDRAFTHTDTGRVTLILADVNGLKAVNDRFGHQAGDRLLRHTAVILAAASKTVGRTALVTRIGGDEFAISSRDVSDVQIKDVLASIDRAAEDLGDGIGIGRGCASLPVRPPGAPSPAMAKRGLLRLADAQLYLHKASSAGGTPRAAARPERPQQHVRRRHAGPDFAASEPASSADSAPPVEARLIDVASGIADAANAAAWWISQQIGDAVIDASCGRTRRDPLKWDEPEQPVALEPKPYSLAEFPATRAALRGGHFYASLTEGDEAERAVLGYHGYRSVLAAGGVDASGTGWLIEIYGDQLTDDLRGWRRNLHSALSTVLTGEGDRSA